MTGRSWSSTASTRLADGSPPSRDMMAHESMAYVTENPPGPDPQCDHVRVARSGPCRETCPEGAVRSEGDPRCSPRPHARPRPRHPARSRPPPAGTWDDDLSLGPHLVSHTCEYDPSGWDSDLRGAVAMA